MRTEYTHDRTAAYTYIHSARSTCREFVLYDVCVFLHTCMEHVFGLPSRTRIGSNESSNAFHSQVHEQEKTQTSTKLSYSFLDSHNSAVLIPSSMNVDPQFSDAGVAEEDASPTPPFPTSERDNRIPIPTNQRDAPRGALYTWYSKEHQVCLSARNYVTFDNGGPDHQKRFTSIFVDPKSGECFPSGRYGTEYWQDDEVGWVGTTTGTTTSMIWFVKKKAAENAAAARAYDYLTYRHGLLTNTWYEQFNPQGDPSLAVQLSDSIPDSAMATIRKLKADIACHSKCS